MGTVVESLCLFLGLSLLTVDNYSRVTRFFVFFTFSLSDIKIISFLLLFFISKGITSSFLVFTTRFAMLN